MDRIHAECSVEEYVSYDDDTAICAGLIDPSNPNWKSEVRNELLDDDLDVQFVSEDTSIDDDFDKELEEPSIKSLAEALHLTDQLRHFAQFNGYQDLALAVGKASDVISSLQLLAPKRQTALTDYFKSIVCELQLISTMFCIFSVHYHPTRHCKFQLHGTMHRLEMNLMFC